MTINITEDTYSWQSAASAEEECQYLKRIYCKEDLKVIFLTEWGKIWMEICAIEGGGSDAIANAILKFQFFFWNIPFSCPITDNVLNVYSLDLILPIIAQSTSSCFKAPARASKHQLVLQSTSSCSNYLKGIHRLKQARLFGEFS